MDMSEKKIRVTTPNSLEMSKEEDVNVLDFTRKEETQPVHFSPLALLGLSYSLLNTWGASSGSIYIGLSAGGPIAIVYGTIFGTLGALTIACSLAEMCQILPTSGAQYHWFFALSDKDSKYKRFFSYLSGWLGTAGWVALTSTAPYFSAQILVVIIQLFHPEFAPGTWFIFVIYMAISIAATLVNIFGVKILGKMTTASFYWSIVGCVTLCVTLLSVSGKNHTLRSGKFIFTTFLNSTGWPDGVAWIMGLLQTQYSIVGADGAAHLVGEIANPRRNAPLAMVFSCLIGGTFSLIVNIAFLAVITDPTAVINSLAGCAMVVIYQGIGNVVGTTILSLFFVINQFFTMPALMVTTSRMIHAYAVDGCLPFKNHIGHISPRYEVPIWAILFNFGWITIFGLMMFGSPLAIIAVQSASVVMLQVSYIPVIILQVVRGRKWIASLDVKPAFTLGPRVGFIVNLIALAYICITTVFFLFPSVYPVTNSSEMNYAIVMFAAAMLIAVLNWFFYARKHYVEPHGLKEILAQVIQEK